MEFKQLVKQFIPDVLKSPLRFYAVRFSALKISLGERISKKDSGGIPLPPPLLRYRVHGALDRESFLTVGERIARELKESLRLVSKDLTSFGHILDFGCGCGRVCRWLLQNPGSCCFYGTDIDEEAISWCRREIHAATFQVNNPLPPLCFPDETFGFIYAVSVFSHLDEDYQVAWLKELKRTAKPNAILILSTHGKAAQAGLSAEDLATLEEKGFLFKVHDRGRFKSDGLPDFYQSAYHTKQYVMDTWSDFFRIRYYIEGGLNTLQDLIVLEKA